MIVQLRSGKNILLKAKIGNPISPGAKSIPIRANKTPAASEQRGLALVMGLVLLTLISFLSIAVVHSTALAARLQHSRVDARVASLSSELAVLLVSKNLHAALQGADLSSQCSELAIDFSYASLPPCLRARSLDPIVDADSGITHQRQVYEVAITGYGRQQSEVLEAWFVESNSADGGFDLLR